MVYVPGSTNEQEEEEPEFELSLPGSPVASEETLSFVLELVGANVDEGLAKAKEMGLTGEDLSFIEKQDIENLLSGSLQRRKLTAVCQYLKDGGTLTHGMTMANVYEGASSEESTDVAVPAESHPTEQEAEPATASNAGNKDWMKDTGNAINKASRQMRQLQRLQRQLGSLMRMFKGCLPG